MRDQLLVGGDDGFAGGKRAANPVFGGMQAADQFDDDVGAGRENIVDALGPYDFGGKPVDFLADHVAIADVSEAQSDVRALAQNSCDGTADGAEAEQGDFIN